MPINPLISNKIKNDNIPDKIKEVLNEVLSREEDMKAQSAEKDHRLNISKILEKYADDEQVINFCENYE